MIRSKLVVSCALFLLATVQALAEDVKVSLPEKIKTTTVRFGPTQTYNRWKVNLDEIPAATSPEGGRQILESDRWKVEYSVPFDSKTYLAKLEGIEGSEGSSIFYFKMAYPRNATLKKITITLHLKKQGSATEFEDVPFVLVYKDKPENVIDYSTQSPDPLSFNVLGVAKDANMLDGTKKETYRAKMNLDLGALYDTGYKLDLGSTLSTKSDDKEAKFNLTMNRKVYATGPQYAYLDPVLEFSGNQAFTNNGLTAKINYVSYGAPLFVRRRSYDDAPADWTVKTLGLAYTHMMRVDPRISASSKKNALYGFFTIDAPSAYFASGFGQINLTGSLFAFDNKTRKDFPGLHTLEGYIDANLLIPVIRPTQDRDGKWSGGTWAKVAWQSGVVRENAFTRSSGLTYGLTIEFKF